MDDTKASSDIQGLDSLHRGELPKSLPQSRGSKTEEDSAGFGYCETLFQFPGRRSEWQQRDSSNGSVDAIQAKQLKLYRFLERQKLEFLFDTLIDAGYDDLDQIAFQMRSTLPLDLQTLEEIGIRKYSHRALLLAAFEDAAGTQRRRDTEDEGVSICCGRGGGRAVSLETWPDLREWLSEEGLQQYHSHFVDAGFADLDKVIGIMKSTCPLTDEVMKSVVKIHSKEHRSRLLRKLQQYSHSPDLRLERETQVSACACTLM